MRVCCDLLAAKFVVSWSGLMTGESLLMLLLLPCSPGLSPDAESLSRISIRTMSAVVAQLDVLAGRVHVAVKLVVTGLDNVGE